ncbi:MAG: TrmH family RNA methyltransferase [bacterium]
MKPKTQRNTVLILNDIRSVYNVGSIFRTADAAGISKIYLVGTTPTPLDRFNRIRKDVAKTALGAEKSVEWEYVKTIYPLLKKIKKEDFYIVAVEQSENSVDYKKVELSERVAIMVGNEVDGISSKVLSQCDCVAEIGMNGKKESLNVSVATGIAIFRMLNI